MDKWWQLATLCDHDKLITTPNLFASCCNFTRSNVNHIKMSTKFDVDLCVTFLNFQSTPKLNGFVNAITLQNVYAPCCSFTGMFSTPKSQRRLTLTFCNFFELSNYKLHYVGILPGNMWTPEWCHGKLISFLMYVCILFSFSIQCMIQHINIAIYSVISHTLLPTHMGV